MAKVPTPIIKKLFKEAIVLFEEQSRTKLADSKKPLFFIEFTEHVNKTTEFILKSDTVYKQYYIRLKSCVHDHVGCSWDYLNAFSMFVHDTPYTKKYGIAKEEPAPTTIGIEQQLNQLEAYPEIPEFPEQHPAFPATPQYPVQLSGFKNVWIKDESYSPNTGTHKDRMAWEVYLFYNREILKRLERRRIQMHPLSIISSGNAALAIQYLFKSKGLPNLKVILDHRLNDELKKAIINSGCQAYFVDLDSKELSPEDILTITDNADGIQLNFTEGIEELKLNYYDWLSYEILNLNPNYIFVPFGSGELYRNITAINTKEILAKTGSKRYFGNKDILRKCHIIGATTYSKKSSLKMLYAKYNNAPSQQIAAFINNNISGTQSQVVEVTEKFVKKASKLADSLGINHEPSGIAGMALLLQMQEQIDVNKKILIVNTGKLRIKQFL